MKQSHALFMLALAVAVASPSLAQKFALPSHLDEVVGSTFTVTASREETLLDIARRFSVGQEEILMANPSVDRWLPADGAEVILPTEYILPRAERKGLVLNVPEMRLYFYPPRGVGEPAVVLTFPVSIGRMDWSTPIGHTKVVGKTENPTWRPPASIIAERISNGESPPQVIPPGPGNPLGRFAFRLGLPGYLIHSTNKPYGVGMRVTHGCLRMYPEDIEKLFDKVAVGTQVQLINQPIKIGRLAGSLFLELHPPLEEDREKYQDYMQNVLNAISDFLADERNTDGVSSMDISLSGGALRQAVEEQSGLPVLISR